MTRSLLRNTVVRAIVGGVAAGALAGFGCKLGRDTYEVVKKRIRRNSRRPPEEERRSAEESS